MTSSSQSGAHGQGISGGGGTVDLYQQRIDDGLCAWCDKPYVVTVSFEECDHPSPACGGCFAEYFEYVGWEFLLEADDGVSRPQCPECCG